ncbi:copper transport protein atx1 [Phtheirospermum japonicum]|uniref:Copper transport protein atx1 n=1 Tax=Phtheirospermum japonicum TaxID=374723 RepID=A0A830BG07_9LAMI|nr:copper transport protein atx1 [Phtheirospermum japonicum]
MDQPSSSSSILLSRSPAIDRHNPIIRDSRRSIIPPSTRSPPRVPVKPHTKNHHKKKSNNNNNINNQKNANKKAAATADDDEIIKVKISTAVRRNSWSCTKPAGDFISPPGSTRYLLSEKVLFNNFSDSDPARKIFPPENPKPEAVKTNGSHDIAKPISSAGSQNQVVVLRVSLHCRGCERKMRKHISRMEGVTSFNIDFAAKKVTVTGNITPLEVLSSISKVKNAQLWPPTISSSSSTSPGLNPTTTSSNSEFKSHEYKGAGA